MAAWVLLGSGVTVTVADDESLGANVGITGVVRCDCVIGTAGQKSCRVPAGKEPLLRRENLLHTLLAARA